MSKKILLLTAFLIGSAILKAEDTIELGTTNVKAKGFYRSQMKENSGKVIITQEEIQKKDYASVSSIFEDAPVTVVHHTAFGPVVDLRGSGERTISRVKVMLNGVPINPLEESMGSIPFDAIPIDSIGAVEITPGSGTTLYGGGTTGGVINIITKSNKQNDYIVLNAGGSSYSTYTAGGAGGINITENLFMNVGEYYRNGKGYRDGEKTERTNFLGGFDYQMTPNQRIRLQTNLYRDNIDSSTELKKVDLEKDRTAAGEKTRTEIDRRGYSLDYINTPTDNLKFTLNLNGAEFDRDVYQHGKQDLFVFPQVMHDFYIGKARLAVRNTETGLKGTFDEKVRGLKVQGEWKYKDKKAKLIFGYEYKKHELDREADMQQAEYFYKDMGLVPIGNQESAVQEGRKHQFESWRDHFAYDAYGKAIEGKNYTEAQKKAILKEQKERADILIGQVLGDTKTASHIISGSRVDKETHALYLLNEYPLTDKLVFKAGARWEHSTYGGTRYNDVKVLFSDISGAFQSALAWGFDISDEEQKGMMNGTVTSLEKDVSYKTMNTRASSDDFGGEVGFTYQYSPKTSFYFRYERGFVSPSPSQLTNRDFLTGVYYPSNVKSEKVDTLEVGTKQFVGNNSFFAATIFASITHDEITLIDYNGNNPMNKRWAYTNLAETNRYGIELQGQHWFGKLKIRESFTYINARIGKDSAYRDYLHSQYSQLDPNSYQNKVVPYKKGDKVPLVSDIKITFGADYQWTPSFTTGATYTYVSGYEMKAPQESFEISSFKTKGYGVLDIYGKYNISENASVRFGVNNVLGEKYNLREDSKYAVPAPERSYFIGLNYRF